MDYDGNPLKMASSCLSTRLCLSTQFLGLHTHTRAKAKQGKEQVLSYPLLTSITLSLQGKEKVLSYPLLTSITLSLSLSLSLPPSLRELTILNREPLPCIAGYFREFTVSFLDLTPQT